MNNKNELIMNINKLHSTELGIQRIKKNLSLDTEDVIGWCKEKIVLPTAEITRKGKNWYVMVDGCILTINAYSYTIITAHKDKSINTWGQKVIQKALEYANYEWYPTEKNVMHGIDEEGRFVETPDITWKGENLDCGWWKVNERNVGIPYGWGNASTLEEFDKGIKEGRYAGNVPEDKKRYGSHYTVGVDCSGLLTICWELPKKIATRDIPNLAIIVEKLEEIRQGDVFAKPGSHVMLFKGFANKEKTEVIIIDATRSTGKVSQRKFKVADLVEQGYVIYRKK